MEALSELRKQLFESGFPEGSILIGKIGDQAANTHDKAALAQLVLETGFIRSVLPCFSLGALLLLVPCFPLSCLAALFTGFLLSWSGYVL